MPTKRKQNIPGKIPRPSRNSGMGRTPGAHRGGFGSRSSSVRPSAVPRAKRSAHARGGFSTSAPHTPGVVGGSSYPTMQPGGDDKRGFSPEVVLTRRNLLIGAAAIGGIAAVGGGVSFAMNTLGQGGSDNTIDHINVAQEAVVDQSSYTMADDYTAYVKPSGEYKLPYGTLVWADNDDIACCLSPTDTASPLATISVLNLSTGNNPTVVSTAEGAADGFEIIDARCSADGIVWVESNAYTSAWRVYTAELSGSTAANTQKVDEGDANWLLPSIAAVGSDAFWQVSPNSEGDSADARAVLKTAAFGSTNANEIYSSKRAFATRVGAADDGVVITPRAESTSVYYQLTKVTSSGQVTDQMTLPSSMTPDIVGYGRSGFAFGFTNIYNFGGGIANLGTYTPRSAVQANNYNDLQWFRFSRTPLSTPCWCGEWFVVKSTTALCGINFANSTYFAVKTISGSDDYGEQLVSSGTRSSFVGLSQVVPSTTTDKSQGYALVRVFDPIKDAIGSAF